MYVNKYVCVIFKNEEMIMKFENHDALSSLSPSIPLKVYKNMYGLNSAY